MGRKRDMKIADMVGKPISKKMDQVEAAVRRDGEQTRREYTKQIDGVKKVVDDVLDDLSAREKKELYDLNTLIDIAGLDETEKRFLVEALYTLAGMTEQITEAQQAFIRSVQKYLNIKNVQTMVDLSSIENIDSIPTQKALLQTITEFLFLENKDHSYMEEYEDVLSYFSVNKRGVQEIQEAISNIYMATGEQGLAEKYGYIIDGESTHDKPIITKDIEEIKKILLDWRNQKMDFYETSSALFRQTMNYDSKMYYMDEDIKSMSACKSKADTLLRSAYNAACSVLSSNSSDGLCGLLQKAFCEQLESKVAKLQHHFRNLRAIGADEKKINLIESYMNPDKLRDTIKEALQQEISDRYYQMDDFSTYTYLIECTEWDMTGTDTTGLWKVLATVAGNVHYQYDCSAAWDEIKKDVIQKGEQYEKSSEAEVKRILIKKHIEPSEFLLDEIQVSLTNKTFAATL